MANLIDVVGSMSNSKPAIITISELHKMHELAETNPGMKDLLEQAQAFYQLAKPEKTIEPRDSIRNILKDRFRG